MPLVRNIAELGRGRKAPPTRLLARSVRGRSLTGARARGLQLACVLAVALPVDARGQADSGDLIAATPADQVNALRFEVGSGRYGRMKSGDLVEAVFASQGPALRECYLALAVRKSEVLPLLMQKLQDGEVHEKRLITKALQRLGWPEALPTLLAMIESDSESPLARIGATYAIGALGDPSAGPSLARVLSNPARSVTEKGLAIASLARVGHVDAIANIRAYVTHPNVRMRITAARALAELGETTDVRILLDEMASEDYVVRQEVCAALGAVGGDEAIAALRDRQVNDPHHSVGQQAQLALLRVEVMALPLTQRVVSLERLLEHEDNLVRRWAMSALATEAGEEGRAALRTKAQNESAIGRMSRSHLLLLDGASPHFRGRY